MKSNGNQRYEIIPALVGSRTIVPLRLDCHAYKLTGFALFLRQRTAIHSKEIRHYVMNKQMSGTTFLIRFASFPSPLNNFFASAFNSYSTFDSSSKKFSPFIYSVLLNYTPYF